MSLTQNLVRINMQRGRKCGSPRLKFHLLLAVYAQDTADAPAEKNRRQPRPAADGKRSLIHHQGTRRYNTGYQQPTGASQKGAFLAGKQRRR